MMETPAKLLPRLLAAIKTDCVATGAMRSAHDLTHDLIVAHYCQRFQRFSRHSRYMIRLAVAAALCHSTDRRHPDETEGARTDRLTGYLLTESFDFIECLLVTNVVLKHHEPNRDEDDEFLILLKDADRVANLGLIAALRSAMHYHALPVADPRFIAVSDPAATYKCPWTILHDVRCALEWDPREGKTAYCLRLPEAIAYATPWFDWLKLGISLEAGRVQECGLEPYPAPEILSDLYAPTAKP